MTSVVEVRPGAYYDSVTLMQVSRAVAAVPGVRAALVAMGTDLNLDLLAEMGFDRPAAGPNDLVLAVQGDHDGAIERARAEADHRLANRSNGAAGSNGTVSTVRPGTTGNAARRTPDASLALVSVPGEHAFVEAMDALRADLSVMIFSDNVSIEQEIALKAEAANRGRLVMGPDCGTAIVAGVGLGFANVVRPGPVSLVAASGTGAQQLCCLLDHAGIGVRHVLGVGGRDMSAAVGAASTLPALAALDADAGTELIVVVSKPPDPGVADRVGAAAAALNTPVLLALLGPGHPDLTAVAADVVGAVGATWSPPPSWSAVPTGQGGGYRRLRGLFAGGTLCHEALVIAAAKLGPTHSNVPLDPRWALPPDLHADSHYVIDFGADELTRGRPHPMIDQRLRLDRLAEEATGSGGTVVLLDVVLGHGAHPDPAAEWAPAIAAALDTAAAHGQDLAVAISLTGTAADPQGLSRQAETLTAAGASVYLSNAAAARSAVALVEPVR